jgi:tetratricopeptide (TPR) repeat protein
MIEVLLALAEQPGSLVTRAALLSRCWGNAPVGEDSLNRAISGVRRGFTAAGETNVQVRTVTGTGYILAVEEEGGSSSDPFDPLCAVEAGWRSWRSGLPAPDREALDRLREAARAEPHRAETWAVLALLARNAAEYADGKDCASFVDECETAAARALELEPSQGAALSALIGLPPLYGDWVVRRRRLHDALATSSGSAPLLHDLAVLEMATGRASAAVPLIEELMERDPLAPLFHYKRVYHLWTMGDLRQMDQVADRAMHLWPRHPAIWFARFWSLAFTARPQHALQQLEDAESRPQLPEPALDTLRVTLAALLAGASVGAHSDAVRANVTAAQLGPAQSVAAIIHLAGLGAVDEAFAVSEGYFLRRGPLAVGLGKKASDPAVTDQCRRVTQMLFLPVTACLRADSRFTSLCDETGLADYWNRSGLTPDFL